MPPTQAVDIWTISLASPVAPVLAPDEITRAARFHSERDRLHWTAARTALRLILADYLQIGPLEIEFTVGEHGKPSIQGGLEFNLSHSRDWAMMAVSEWAPVGVDLEAIRHTVPIAKLLARAREADLPTEDLTALFQRWTHREARTKATGTPLLQNPSPDSHPVALEAPPGFTASVALVGRIPEPRYRGKL